MEKNTLIFFMGMIISSISILYSRLSSKNDRENIYLYVAYGAMIGFSSFALTLILNSKFDLPIWGDLIIISLYSLFMRNSRFLKSLMENDSKRTK